MCSHLARMCPQHGGKEATKSRECLSIPERSFPMGLVSLWQKITPEEDNQEGKWGTPWCGISGQISVRNLFTPTNEIWVCSWLWKTNYFYCHSLCTHLQLISSQAEWAVDARMCFNHRSNLCLLLIPLWGLGGGNWGRALGWRCLEPSWVFLFPWSHICHTSICAAPEVPEIFVEDKNLNVPASLYNLGGEFR